jgi:fibronectin type 3 domain-containing protein
MKRYLVIALLCASAFGQAKPRATVKAATATTAPSVALSWTASAGTPPANVYNVYRGTAVGSLSVIGSSATTSFTDNSVAFATTYFYAVTGVNTATCPSGQTCESAQSAAVSATIPGNPVPAPPTGLTVGTITATNVPLQWSAPVNQAGMSTVSYSVFDCWEANCPSPSPAGTTTATSYTANCTHDNKLCYFEIKANDLVNGAKVLTAASNIVKAQVD